jgi:hypothetical protein
LVVVVLALLTKVPMDQTQYLTLTLPLVVAPVETPIHQQATVAGRAAEPGTKVV